MAAIVRTAIHRSVRAYRRGRWQVWRESVSGIAKTILTPASHGVRTIDNLRNWCGITDDKLLEVSSSLG